MSLLVDVSELEILLKQDPGSLVGDPYTMLMMEGATAVVRDTAQQPNWVLEVTGPDDVLAPARARFIALYLAKRAWEDQGNLVRRTTGPISLTFREEGVYGLDLTDDEREWLENHQPDGGGGLYIMRNRGSGTASRLPFGDETPDGYSFAAGDLDFAHGMTMSGPARADNW